LLAAAAAQAGASVWVSFVLAAVLSLLTGLSYAALSSMFPSAAGEHEYTRQAMPEWVAFVVGWMMIVGLVVAAATVSLGFGRYVGHLVEASPRVAGLALLALESLVAVAEIKQSARLTVTMSAVQVGGLLLIVGIGLPHLGDLGRASAGVVAAIAIIAAVTDFAVYLVFLAVNGTAVVLRRLRQEMARRFTVPGTLAGVPVAPVLGIVSVLVMMPYLDMRAVALGTGLSAVGLFTGCLIRARTGA